MYRNGFRYPPFPLASSPFPLPSFLSFPPSCSLSPSRSLNNLSGLPWTYQIDTYGLCGVIHCLLHGTYMEVSEQNVGGSNRFRPKLPFRRYWQGALWTQLFDQLLNISACHPRPSLTPLRQTFENFLLANPLKIRDILTPPSPLSLLLSAFLHFTSLTLVTDQYAFEQEKVPCF